MLLSVSDHEKSNATDFVTRRCAFLCASAQGLAYTRHFTPYQSLLSGQTMILNFCKMIFASRYGQSISYLLKMSWSIQRPPIKFFSSYVNITLRLQSFGFLTTNSTTDVF